MTKFLIIGLGGFLGANARYLVGGWVAERLGPSFPFGTLVVNVSGCFVIGLVLTLLVDRFVLPPEARLFFVIGFLGAYTTFSSYAFESLSLIETRAYLAAVANLVGNVVLGMLAVVFGATLARLL
ncbi:MAG: fluoride efflux transporter CrcB [Chloroflexota bacterium]